MKKDFTIEFDYFANRNMVYKLLGYIADQHREELSNFFIFVNNIQSSLEYFVFLSYKQFANEEIEFIRRNLFCFGKYRPDLSFELLFSEMNKRRFNSFSVIDSSDVKSILMSYWYQSEGEVPQAPLEEGFINRLKKIGYDAFEKTRGRTTLFISHSSKQKKEMNDLIPNINSVNELVWLDKYRLDPNENDEIVRKEIINGLLEADKVLFYITKDFMRSKWCRFELEYSLGIFLYDEKYTLMFIIDDDIKNEFFNQYEYIRTHIKCKYKKLRSNQLLSDLIASFFKE